MQNDLIFGRKLMIFAGHWAQTLPVIRHGSMAQIIGASMKMSAVWGHLVQAN
jgi:ATP-dependent DNA helicase PIF1